MPKIITSNVIILDDKRNILLVKRADVSDFGNLWSLPGGTVQEGETIEEALMREIKEELGCSLTSYRYFQTFDKTINDKSISANYFVGTIGDPITIDETELSEFKWFQKSEIPSDLAFDQNSVLNEYWKSLG